MKIHVAAQVEGVGIGRLVELPPLGYIRNHPVVLAVRRQPGKQQKVNFAVLIQRRVDGCIIAAAVDQSFGGILRRGLPAGRQAPPPAMRPEKVLKISSYNVSFLLRGAAQGVCKPQEAEQAEHQHCPGNENHPPLPCEQARSEA